jgi:uncharacterized membrane protein (DUF373 family)
MKPPYYYFERIIVVVMQLLLVIVIALAVYELWLLLFKALAAHWFSTGRSQAVDVETIPDLQRGMQRIFAGVLLVLLGLELLETLKAYFSEHRVRVEVILIVAIIAVGRHIIQLDFEHASGAMLAGIGALTLALTGGYYLIKRSLTQDVASTTPSSAE